MSMANKPLTDLPKLKNVILKALWRQFFGESPSPELRRALMIPMLGHRIQERSVGSLNLATRARLRQLSRAFEADSHSPILTVRGIRPGTRLVRRWRSQIHLVNVEENGYEYQGARYKSLSQIARLITGTRWSGPLFFGIKPGQKRRKLKEVG